MFKVQTTIHSNYWITITPIGGSQYIWDGKIITMFGLRLHICVT